MSSQTEQPPENPKRVIIEEVSPEINAGLFPAKRVVGESLTVEADIFADGHDKLDSVIRFKGPNETSWREVQMRPLQNDRWQGGFFVDSCGIWQYTIFAWIDRFRSWKESFRKKAEAGQNIEVDLRIGIELIQAASNRTSETDLQQNLQNRTEELLSTEKSVSDQLQLVLDKELSKWMHRAAERFYPTEYKRKLEVMVEPILARTGAWYEFFPRSFGSKPGEHGTFREAESQLPRIAEMGFDVVYLPPIHPIGKTFRKGKNNELTANRDDPGSPWAIGSEAGGHKSIHPDLGTIEDFQHFVKIAKQEHRLEVAIDIAFQCSPDHPYVKKHPEWFVTRPDGSIQYAENPPKKYQDIYPLDFESSDWKNLWQEMKSIFEFWIDCGISVFRVDNPHTKPLPFWHWLIRELKKNHPEIILLSEAFTRPKVMYRLAKLGFSQSYNYFPWRNTKRELTEFMSELSRPPLSEFFRPSLWPNTPDILPAYLQYGGQPAFMIRLILAAMLGATYGIYGPAFELCDHIARETGSEEYLDSEKYQIKNWNFDSPDNLSDLIQRVNRIRRENIALHSNETLYFHSIDNEQILAFSKHSNDPDNLILTIVNLDPHHTQSGWLEFDLREFKIELSDHFQAHDLLSGARYLWHGNRHYIELNPQFIPAQIFRIRRRIRTEEDFDYFM